MKRSARDDEEHSSASEDNSNNGSNVKAANKKSADKAAKKQKVKKDKNDNLSDDADQMQSQHVDPVKWNPAFLVSTPLRGKEINAGHEFVRIVDEFASDLIGKKKMSQSSSSTAASSISDIISSQINNILSKSEDLTVNNISTVGMCLVRSKSKDIDTLSVLRKVIKSLSKSDDDAFIPKLCTKVSPIQHVCIAKVDAIIEMAVPLVKEHFKSCSAPTFAVVLRERMTAEMDKSALKKALAIAVHEVAPQIKVDLKNPQTVILVEVVKSIAGVTIIDDYPSLFNLNLKTASLSTPT